MKRRTIGVPRPVKNQTVESEVSNTQISRAHLNAVMSFVSERKRRESNLARQPRCDIPTKHASFTGSLPEPHRYLNVTQQHSHSMVRV